MTTYQVSYSFTTNVEADDEEEAMEIGYETMLDNVGACDMDCWETEEDEENEELLKVSVMDRGSIKFHT